MSNTQSSDTPHRPLPRLVRGTLRVVREQLTATLETCELEAALADESLEYRRGVADAAAVAAELIGLLERDEDPE